ncbi:EbsA family protein [Companilactobacillus sp.]|jgi:hypothetical protein|uniref:EbsA family protein n=1 Tax=Companilactobacillus sp. TaxID=2767905 RepID=UPI0025BEFA72|nr:EbsA family protein [Companilactobacillus sp.]MCH4008256.1 EbsA family protein [Companilactobacillus sp.]MCH4051565.1 EbsA family protein [Companilactobacillus sp.]MCH4076199.1 EbsA family protein [Companilactobacillus sp.]MCH4124774.1 EbsA family protein [Companilactobacillus sp.]MCH4131316.1 EbsA family protein [Companilactobacillus sp.]
MSKKYYIQPTGAWGIILWSVALIIIFFGVILQLEIFSLNVIPILIWIIGLVYIFYIIKSSWIKVSDNQIIIKAPNYHRTRSFDLKNVSVRSTNKFQLEFDFDNHDYFPVKITSTTKVLEEIKKRVGDQ